MRSQFLRLSLTTTLICAAFLSTASSSHAACGDGAGLETVGGAAVGGVVGRQFGGGTGKDLLTIGGAVLGGVLANRAKQASNDADCDREEMKRKMERIEANQDRPVVISPEPVIIHQPPQRYPRHPRTVIIEREVVVVAPAPVRPTIVHPGEYQAFINAMYAQSFDNNRIRALGGYTANWSQRGLTIDAHQAHSLLVLFDFDRGRMEALNMILPLLAIHPASVESLVSTFSFSSNKNEARSLLLNR